MKWFKNWRQVAGWILAVAILIFLGRTLLTAFIVLLIGYLFFLRLSKNFGEEL